MTSGKTKSEKVPLSFLAKITALLLLALWLPATMHCDLEAAVLLQNCASSDTCCQDSHEPCADPTCRDFTSTSTHPILAPSLYAESHWVKAITVLLPQLALTVIQPPGTCWRHGDTPAIESIARTWSFVRRSALPARAPASVA